MEKINGQEQKSKRKAEKATNRGQFTLKKQQRLIARLLCFHQFSL
jgi:hypothetical protein